MIEMTVVSGFLSRVIRGFLVAILPISLVLGSCSSPPLRSIDSDPLFNTFSIAAIDPETGEAGVAVTTRVVCVGNAVPWVRAGVGAVATQSWTRMEYGVELLDLLEAGESPEAAMRARVAADEGRERRQVAVISVDGRSSQFTGSEAMAWAGHRAGENYVAQGNLLVGPEVLEAVSESFEASAGSGRHLADRLIEALEAGQAVGGDARSGRPQSAALLVADPREGMALRDDKISVNLNICEDEEPVGELRRQYDAVSEALGYRTLEQPVGSDVAQLKVILHSLGYFRPGVAELDRGADWRRYTPEVVAAVDSFRVARGLSSPAQGSPPGWVDRELVAELWAALEEEGKAGDVRRAIRDLTVIRR